VSKRSLAGGLRGNALIRRAEGTQNRAVELGRLARHLATFVQKGYDLLLVQATAPGPATSLIQVEEAVTKVPPVPWMSAWPSRRGHRIPSGALLVKPPPSSGIRKDVVTLVSRAVDRSDRDSGKPSKPSAPSTRATARYLTNGNVWLMVEDSGRGYRKVVLPPRPREVLFPCGHFFSGTPWRGARWSSPAGEEESPFSGTRRGT